MDIQTAIEILQAYNHDDDKEGEKAFQVTYEVRRGV